MVIHTVYMYIYQAFLVCNWISTQYLILCYVYFVFGSVFISLLWAAWDGFFQHLCCWMEKSQYAIGTNVEKYENLTKKQCFI